jgi:hypothetical protein
VPTVLRSGPYRFYFYSHEPDEPPHVHVDRARHSAEYWLRPVKLAYEHGFAPFELNRIENLVRKHRLELLEAWHEFFGTQSG